MLVNIMKSIQWNQSAAQQLQNNFVPYKKSSHNFGSTLRDRNLSNAIYNITSFWIQWKEADCKEIDARLNCNQWYQIRLNIS